MRFSIVFTTLSALAVANAQSSSGAETSAAETTAAAQTTVEVSINKIQQNTP